MSTQATEPSLMALPTELLDLIYDDLPVGDLRSLRVCCHRLNNITANRVFKTIPFNTKFLCGPPHPKKYEAFVLKYAGDAKHLKVNVHDLTPAVEGVEYDPAQNPHHFIRRVIDLVQELVYVESFVVVEVGEAEDLFKTLCHYLLSFKWPTAIQELIFVPNLHRFWNEDIYWTGYERHWEQLPLRPFKLLELQLDVAEISSTSTASETPHLGVMKSVERFVNYLRHCSESLRTERIRIIVKGSSNDDSSINLHINDLFNLSRFHFPALKTIELNYESSIETIRYMTSQWHRSTAPRIQEMAFREGTSERHRTTNSVGRAGQINRCLARLPALRTVHINLPGFDATINTPEELAIWLEAMCHGARNLDRVYVYWGSNPSLCWEYRVHAGIDRVVHLEFIKEAWRDFVPASV